MRWLSVWSSSSATVDPQLQVVSNKAVTLKDQPAQQLDTVISANNQTSLVLGLFWRRWTVNC